MSKVNYNSSRIRDAALQYCIDDGAPVLFDACRFPRPAEDGDNLFGAGHIHGAELGPWVQTFQEDVKESFVARANNKKESESSGPATMESFGSTPSQPSMSQTSRTVSSLSLQSDDSAQDGPSAVNRCMHAMQTQHAELSSKIEALASQNKVLMEEADEAEQAFEMDREARCRSRSRSRRRWQNEVAKAKNEVARANNEVARAKNEVKAKELELNQQYNEKLMQLQQAAQVHRAELEQQARRIIMEYQQRRVQEEGANSAASGTVAAAFWDATPPTK